MKTSFSIPQQTLDAQRKASDPTLSAWVSANAGAGKTKVLVDRVVRLLLSGTPPSRILCLTFTKAAATNMSLRVVALLREWVTKSDAELKKELQSLEGRVIKPSDLAAARRLFARAVETPGGLKIETIHAFCERILHLAPFEAGVPAQFRVLEETSETELMQEAYNETIAQALQQRDEAVEESYRAISSEAAHDLLIETVFATIKKIPDIEEAGGIELVIEEIRLFLGLYPKDTIENFQKKLIHEGLSSSDYQKIIEALSRGSKTDQKKAESFRTFIKLRKLSIPFEEQWLPLQEVYFDSEDQPRSEKSIVTKSIDPDIKNLLLQEQSRLMIERDRLRSLQALKRTYFLWIFSEAVYRRYIQKKMNLSALDFDDLIHKTLMLLKRGDTAWILYKLDRGIDHILVDEAQDTNPEQWQILRYLTEEFTAGWGVYKDKVRTIFAVGDPKQSIYSFQGAAPREFEESQKDWLNRSIKASIPFEAVNLTLSFRTAPAVLSAVDATFKLPENYKGLSFNDKSIGTIHESARPNAPGQVELWEPQEAQDLAEPEAGDHPVDAVEANSAPVLLAKKIAQAIKTWTFSGDENGRRWKAGDILILVRKRGTAFEAVIRALKLAGIPVSGQDRLNISEHIAVMDLISVGRAALLPEDDLSLAEALKSPLVGFSDEDLERITLDREENLSLAQILEEKAYSRDEQAEKGWNALSYWKDLAQRHGPFGFYATLLGSGRARSDLVAQLGYEAADAIDAFLSFARSAETSDTPSLFNFITRFETTDHVIKRDLETQRDEVRVMTVHGAKGLEAPLVVVIDGGDSSGKASPLLDITLPSKDISVPLWVPSPKSTSDKIKRVYYEKQSVMLEEHHRLLYVAMTRAKDRLVIAPYLSRRTSKMSENSWSFMITKGLEQSGREIKVIETSYGTAQIWLDQLTQPVGSKAEDLPFHFQDQAPEWLHQSVSLTPEPLPPLRPSHLGIEDYKETSFKERTHLSARKRGLLIHTLLERLPKVPLEKRQQTAFLFLTARAPLLTETEKNNLIKETLKIIEDPRLTALFDIQAKTEASISGEIEIKQRIYPVSGRIDRLAILQDHIYLADFKSDPKPPENMNQIRQSYLRQMALYHALLQKIFPERAIKTYLIYTASSILWELPESLLYQVLEDFH